jgi:hypothetical protein
MLNFIVVRIVFLDRNFYSLLNVVHVSVEMGDKLNVLHWLRDVQRLLFVYDFSDHRSFLKTTIHRIRGPFAAKVASSLLSFVLGVKIRISTMTLVS